jgi:formate-dependent nitrite reductase cytochrome c552 subunit
MARKYESGYEYDTRVIEEEIDRHQREYEKAQERYGYSASNSGEKTMRKHDVLSNALSMYLRSAKERQTARTKLSDVHDLVCANLKRIEEGWNDLNTKAILQHIKAILERED